MRSRETPAENPRSPVWFDIMMFHIAGQTPAPNIHHQQLPPPRNRIKPNSENLGEFSGLCSCRVLYGRFGHSGGDERNGVAPVIVWSAPGIGRDGALKGASCSADRGVNCQPPLGPEMP